MCLSGVSNAQTQSPQKLSAEEISKRNQLIRAYALEEARAAGQVHDAVERCRPELAADLTLPRVLESFDNADAHTLRQIELAYREGRLDGLETPEDCEKAIKTVIAPKFRYMIDQRKAALKVMGG